MKLLATYAFLSLVALGCSTSNASYCDETKSCASADEPYCDIEFNECTAAPVGTCDEINLCEDAESPFCVDSQCVECENTSDCDEGFSCDSQNACVPFSCNPGEGENADCSQINPATPFCADDGASCRGCEEHNECASGICERDSSECVAAAEIIHVAKTGDLTPDCGEADSPCLTVQSGLEQVGPTRAYLHIVGGSYDEQLSLINTEVTIVGSQGASIEPIVTENSTVLGIEGSSQVVVEGVDLRANPRSGVFATVAKCVGPNASLALIDLTVGGATNIGVSASECAVTGQRLRVTGNSMGISIEDGPLHLEDSLVSVTTAASCVSGTRTAMTITGSTLSECNTVGISLSDGALTLAASMIAGNRRGGVDLENSDFTLTNNFVVDNGELGTIGWGGLSIHNDEDHSPQVLEFNTIAGNRIAGSLSAAANLSCNTFAPTSGHSNIVYKTFTESSQPNISLGNCNLQYSNIEGGASGTGNIDADPQFINAEIALGDYHLQQSSPSRNAAAPTASGVDVDFDGDERSQGGRSDMGADEVLAP